MAFEEGSTLLAMTQDVCAALGLPSPSVVLTSQDPNIIFIRSQMASIGKGLAEQHRWANLTREASITLTSNVASYALSADFNYAAMETMWNRTSVWPCYGPISPQEWQKIKAVGGVPVVSNRFRLKGTTSKPLTIDPTPTETGDTLYYEYQSLNWCRPKKWVASTAFAATSYCWYEGNYYYSTAGGTTGTTAPTHVTGSASDGGVTWIYQDIVYDTFLADTDYSFIPNELLKDGVAWQWKRKNTLQYEDEKREWLAAIKNYVSDTTSARTVSLRPRRHHPFVSVYSLPEGDW